MAKAPLDIRDTTTIYGKHGENLSVIIREKYERGHDMKKIYLVLFNLLLILAIGGCGSSGVFEKEDGAYVAEQEVDIPKSANKILPDTYVDVKISEGNLEISFYGFSDDIASSVYCYVCMVVKLSELDITEDIVLSIYTNEENISTSLNELNSAEDIGSSKLPAKWIECLGENTIRDSVTLSTATLVEESVESYVIEPIEDYLKNGETKILFNKQYELDGGILDIVLEESGKGLTLNIAGSADTEEKAYLLFAAVVVEFDNLCDEFYSCLCTIDYKDVRALFQQYSENKIISGYDRNGTFTMETPDWLDKDISSLEMGDSEVEEYILKVEEKLKDFGDLSGYKMGYLLEQ